MSLRKIVHIDMDAFYASVEQRDDPALRRQPVAVGSARARGVVAAASYEARVFGVRSAMASVTALRRCPALVFVPPRFDVYRAVSQQIRAIFADYTDLIEPLSLDEAYLDVTEDRRGIGSATAIAAEIRARIKADTGLTASAGVSYNKFIAKLASDQNKPDGLCVIKPAQGPAFVAALPVKRFHGVGPVTAAKMERLGIHTGADLRDRSIAELARHFGSSAGYFHRAAHGEDDRPVRPDRPSKSIGAERTFGTDLAGRADLERALEPVIDAAWARIARAGASGRTLTLKAKFADFRLVARSRTTVLPMADRDAIAVAAHALLRSLLPVDQGIRLLGVTLSGLDDGTRARAQPPLDLGDMFGQPVAR
ncbi:DNA polymerase IV [Polymorphobacter fuscus]|uniref:DNA polymerase IV n=1 Tax=Sandarakinorhabdus fusca TaxID=1439888 RepID=A0A7C9LHT4_9SPHN|nr:DNA polymerase IV [Polymorphobacter fuscus]KAB7644086.1 DNA polymerase IV [Polymorphobacter fuscus]MQT18467.1 DNA polymerase IV [Polymorphobacter fuscus]NJC08412.1 DNA polymerase-4 [Polymorphobacter fuscus]